MQVPPKRNSEPGVPECEPRDRKIRLEETDWFARARLFLEEHPGSTLLSIVQHLCPTFCLLPEERRMQYWVWLENDFTALRDGGQLCSRVLEDGVTVWSLPDFDRRNIAGSLWPHAA